MVAQVVAGGSALRVQHAGGGHGGDYRAGPIAPDLGVDVRRRAGGHYIQGGLRRAGGDADSFSREIAVQHAADVQLVRCRWSTGVLVVADDDIPRAGS